MKKSKVLLGLFITLCLIVSLAQSSYASSVPGEGQVIETFESDPSEVIETNETVETTETGAIAETTETGKTDETPEPSESNEGALESANAALLMDAASDGTTAFVTRLYDKILNREPDDDGLNAWVDTLNSGTNTGADIIGGFIFSQEFINLNLSNEDYVEILYQAIMGRDSDASGKAAWLDILNTGFSRRYVCAGFIDSVEFQNLCDEYGIKTGTLTLTSSTDRNPMITQFVSTLYQTVLNRYPDANGLDSWVRLLANRQSTAAETVSGFVLSQELKNQNLSNADFIEILYRSVLGRASNGTEGNGWLSILNQGLSQRYILNQFISSQEFANICSTYQITRGELKMSEYRDYNKDLTMFIYNAYSNCFKRTANTGELNHWAELFYRNTVTINSFLSTLVFAPESAPYRTTNERFVTLLFETLLRRQPNAAEISNWTNYTNQTSRENAYTAIFTSSEFINLCKSLNITLTMPDGWVNLNGNVYYYQNNNTLSGWQRIGGSLYYFIPTEGNRRASGWTYADGLKYYFDANGILVQDVDSILGQQSSYYVKVNTTLNVITIYAKDGANGYIIPVKNMVCSVGKASTPTVKGTFTIQRLSYWGELIGPVWGQYVSRISGDYLFHSSWYYVNGNRYTLSISEYNKLGTAASHGCVRLTVADAKWIFDNCNGSTVTVFSSSSIGNMFAKPTAPSPVTISGDRGYDTTDPALR